MLVAVVLLVANLVCLYALLVLKDPFTFGWRFLFDKRMNFPYFFSFGLLFFSIYMCYKISHAPREVPGNSFWKILGILIAFIAVDKFFHLHNTVRTFTSNTLEIYVPSSPLHFIWAVPFLIVIGYLVWRLARQIVYLPGFTRKKLFLAGSLFTFGLIFLELTGVFYGYMHQGKTDVYLILIKTAEEFFQIMGLVMLIDALVSYYGYLSVDTKETTLSE
jgi:hypothetical protein